MDLALLVLRLVVGIFFVGHGAQKLWGSFGGHGPDGTGQFFEALGLTPGRRNALAAGWSEAIGGALLAFGLFSPLGAVLIISVMTVAIITVHGQKGPWATDGGYEYNLVLAASAFLIAANPGDWSLDAAFGLGGIHGTAFALGALVLGVIGGYLAVMVGRSGAGAPAPAAGEPAVETIVAADEVADAARFERGEAPTEIR
ncbi:MAG: DoxX family protein [Solirubrobacteraceae bacterium]|nr:DoxX family protein [Solirubrobacteraceae bacterium]